jgi:hypothetical protein
MLAPDRQDNPRDKPLNLSGEQARPYLVNSGGSYSRRRSYETSLSDVQTRHYLVNDGRLLAPKTALQTCLSPFTSLMCRLVLTSSMTGGSKNQRQSFRRAPLISLLCAGSSLPRQFRWALIAMPDLQACPSPPPLF